MYEKSSCRLERSAISIAIKQLNQWGRIFNATPPTHRKSHPFPIFWKCHNPDHPAALTITFENGGRYQTRSAILITCSSVVSICVTCHLGRKPGQSSIQSMESIGSEIWKGRTCALGSPIQPFGNATTSPPMAGEPIIFIYSPGRVVTLWMMQLGAIIFGGVGSGLYGMLAFVFMQYSYQV